MFFDSNWNNTVNTKINQINKKNTGYISSTSSAPCLAWCRQLNQRMAFLPLLKASLQPKAFLTFHQQTTNLTVYRLVCEETVEDSISKKTLQQKLLGDLKLRTNNKNVGVNESIIAQTGTSNLGQENVSTFWKIKRQTLEDLLFNNQHPHTLPIGGDNGIFNTNLETTEGKNKVR